MTQTECSNNFISCSSKMMSARFKKNFLSLPFLLILTFLVRIIFCLFIYPKYGDAFSSGSKSFFLDNYYDIAKSLIAGKGFLLNDGSVVLHRPPLYSLVLVIPLFLSGFISELLAIQIFNALLAVLGVFFTVKTSYFISKNYTKALIAGYIVSLWPFSIWVTRLTIPENLLFFLVPFAIYFSLRFIEKPTFTFGFITGIAYSALWLTHATYIAFIFPLIVLLFFKTRLKSLIVAFVICLFISPWFIRNAHYGLYSFQTATGFGQHYFIGWYYYERLQKGESYFAKDAYLASHKFSKTYPIEHNVKPITNDRDRSNLALVKPLDELAKEHLFSHLWDNIKKIIIKFPLLWVQQQTPQKALINFILLLPILVFALRAFIRYSFNLNILIFPLICTSLAFSAVCVECAPMRYALPLFSIHAIIATLDGVRKL